MHKRKHWSLIVCLRRCGREGFDGPSIVAMFAASESWSLYPTGSGSTGEPLVRKGPDDEFADAPTTVPENILRSGSDTVVDSLRVICQICFEGKFVREVQVNGISARHKWQDYWSRLERFLVSACICRSIFTGSVFVDPTTRHRL
jgi:hypothetical protein